MSTWDFKDASLESSLENMKGRLIALDGTFPLLETSLDESTCFVRLGVLIEV